MNSKLVRDLLQYVEFLGGIVQIQNLFVVDSAGFDETNGEIA